MPKTYISQITLPSGNTYTLKDADLRAAVGIQEYDTGVAYSKGDYLHYDGNLYIVDEDIDANDNTQFSDVDTSALDVNADINAKYNELKGLIAGGVHYRGVTSTPLTDGETDPDITINGDTYTAEAGDLVIYQDNGSSTGVDVDREFIYSGTVWNEFGAGIGTFGELAFVDEARGTYNGETISGVTATGSISGTATITTTPTTVESTGNFTPAGDVSVTINTLTQTPTAAGLTREDYTPSGSIEVTNPTVTISTDAQSGDVSVVTGVAVGGTDTVNKVSAGSAVAVATTDTAVAVAYQMKSDTGYATSFTTNGIKDVTVATETTSPEFNVPTNAISGGTISTDAQTGSSVVTGLAAQDATSLFYSATVQNETLSFSTTALSTGKLGFSGTAAETQGYKLSKTDSDTANVGVDTKNIIPAKSNGTITPVTIGDSVTVIKNSGLSSAYVKATATNGAASFTGNKETGLKVTGVSYDKATANGATASFTGSQGSVSVSGSYDKADSAATVTANNVSLSVDDIVVSSATITVSADSE